MKRFLVLLVTLAVSISVLPSAASDGSGLSLPMSTFVGDLTAGPDGNVWFSARNFSGTSPRVVGKVTPGGEVAEYGVPEGADSIVTGADGNLWFTEADGIGRITPGGSASSFKLAAGTGAPRALAAGPDGNIWSSSGDPPPLGAFRPAVR